MFRNASMFVAFFFSFIGSVFGLGALYRLSGAWSGWTAAIFALLLALALGVAAGCLFGRAGAKAVAVGTFSGIAVLWIPIVLITYGAAIVAFPALLAFTAVTYMSTKLGAAIIGKRQHD